MRVWKRAEKKQERWKVKLRSEGKGKRGTRGMEAKGRGRSYHRGGKRKYRILNIKRLVTRKKKAKYWVSKGPQSMIHT